MTETARPDWALATLTEMICGVREARTRGQAIRETLDCVVESLDAEIGMVVSGDEIVASFGLGTMEVAPRELSRVAPSRHSSIELVGLGSCATLAANVDGHAYLRILAIRTGHAFDANEGALLESMANTLGLMLTLLDRIETEQATRKQTQAFFEITNAIARRMSYEGLHQLIASHTRELLDVDSVILRVVSDAGSASLRTRVVYTLGLSEAEAAGLNAIVGPGANAIDAGDVVHLTGDGLTLLRTVLTDSQCAAAAPILSNGVALGSLGVSTNRAGRRFTENELRMLQALAELASIVFNDARTLQAVNDARHDLLTGVPGRGLILDRLSDRLIDASQGSVAVLFLDLDNFKPVNDRFGHEVGDAVLRILAARMQAVVGQRGEVGRIGGDEFLMFASATHPDEGGNIAEQVIVTMNRPIPITVGPRTFEVEVGASVGLVMNGFGSTPRDLMSRGDRAMYRAKANGGNQWCRLLEMG